MAKELAFMDKTVQETNKWLKEIGEGIHHPSRQMAYHALRGVLFALRDRLPVAEAVQLSAQLPLLIRGIYFEGYQTANRPLKLDKEQFLARVADELQQAGGGNPEKATGAVLAVLECHIGEGETADIRGDLPQEIRALWPERIPV